MRRAVRIMALAVAPFLVTTAVAGPDGNTGIPEKKPGHPSLSIASGGIGGLFYPAAGAICQALVKNLSRDGKRHLHCGVETSGGSRENLAALADHEVEFGLAQSEAIRRAWEGETPFPRAMKELRSVVTLYTESFTLAVSVKSGIKKLEDLQGKRLTLGISDPATERVAREMLTACGFKPEETGFKFLQHDLVPQALRQQEIQAHLFMVGHPDERVWNLASTEPVHWIPLTGSCLEPLLAKKRHYVKAVIPGGIYPGVESDTPTLGLKATLMASADTPDELVHAVTKAVVEKLYRFRRVHPDVEVPDPKTLFEGLVAPLHLGAFRYFQELRVLEYKNSGVDILSGVPELLQPDGSRQALGITPRAGELMQALRLPIGSARAGEPGIPFTLATSPAAAKSGSAHWLMVESPPEPG
ncbi:MAG: TAXI family TRAP transporter solute-binding subunit [Magnetococcales bacterium]|nr:TAXI family TRAP transporter solute-binding subunit [Magnetococcales bacterium]